MQNDVTTITVCAGCGLHVNLSKPHYRTAGNRYWHTPCRLRVLRRLAQAKLENQKAIGREIDVKC